jgi:hypothetical protein
MHDAVTRYIDVAAIKERKVRCRCRTQPRRGNCGRRLPERLTNTMRPLAWRQ